MWVVSFELILNLCSFVKNTHNSLLIAHCSKASGRREARWANSRGFLNPWNNWQDKEIASGRRGTATLTTDSRLCRRRYYVIVKYRGLESPRLLKSPSLTLSKLLTLGIAQASLALLSLNRNFPDVFRSQFIAQSVWKMLIHECNALQMP